MLERIVYPNRHLARTETTGSNRTRFSNPLRLKGRGAAEPVPLSQDVPIIPFYRLGPIVWMNLVVLKFTVNPVLE